MQQAHLEVQMPVDTGIAQLSLEDLKGNLEGGPQRQLQV